jgi:hypothetical protein
MEITTSILMDSNDLNSHTMAYLALLILRIICNTGPTGENSHHAGHLGLQVLVFNFSSDSESKDDFDASEFDDCDGF